MFVDIAKIKIKAGNGGDGAVTFHREKYVASGGPDGGDGGKGGDIIFEVDDNLPTLADFRYKRKYTAPDGKRGDGGRRRGKNGENLVIKIPRGTIIREAESNAVMADMSEKTSFVAAKGGRGGWGNTHFKTPTRQTPRFAKSGTPGEEWEVILELKLLADVGLLGFPKLGIAGAAWLGAALVLGIVMAVSRRIKDIMVILILGMMFGSAASAVVQILQYLSTDSALKSFVIWTMGSLGGVSLAQLGLMSGIVLAGLILSVYLIKPLNLLLLGENYARTMGLNVRITRLLLFVSTTLLAGTVTAFCGPIGFIGIAVPHVARMLTGNADHRILMPASILLGSVTMLLCDIIAQLPGREMVLPVNTVTALLGIPIVVLVIVRNRKIF